jgi:hypothetical protein
MRRVFGGGLKGGKRAAGFLDQGVPGLGRQRLEPVQRDLGGGVETVGFALGHFDERA